MADFNQAIEWLKEGKKVTRHCDVYCKLVDNDIKYFNYSNESVINQNMDIFSLEATDWMIYDEEDNWNITFNMKSNKYVGYYVDSDLLETLKEKILEDLENNEGVIDMREILDKRFGFQNGN